MSSKTPAPLDLKNVQGDILAGIVKKTETYLFFQIGQDVAGFRKQLSELIPLITSTAQVFDHKDKIAQHKKEAAKHGRSPPLLKISAVNIAFAHRGILKLGITDSIGDSVFDGGMLADAGNLGDAGTKSPSGHFTPNWDPAFKSGNIDGLIFISGDCHSTVKAELKKIEEIFAIGTSHALIKEIFTISGDVRPGKEKGHEHFGFLDGISQPAVAGVGPKPNPGQETVPQGIMLLGRDQDTDTRPPWALDGSFLSFRYLTQLVPEFNEFLEKNPTTLPGMKPEEAKQFTGARMVGRWKSGAPLDLAPTKDDPELGADPLRNNDFSYGFPEDKNGQSRCPFAAHLRKTNPRDDLEKDLNPPTPTTPRRIIRRGIPFGPELTKEEIEGTKTIHERGLLFVAYSSNIANGFQFVQKSWANNANFPPQKTNPDGTAVVPGLDPIIGQLANDTDGPRKTLGISPLSQNVDTTLPTEWVVPKGGEYLFTPSIPALRNTFALQSGKDEL